jgi:hypothetical protein
VDQIFGYLAYQHHIRMEVMTNDIVQGGQVIGHQVFKGIKAQW